MNMQQNDVSPDTTTLYVWLSRDQDGIEGMIAAPLPDMIYPLVFTDQDRAERFAPYAEASARERGFPATLVRFTRAEVIAQVSPDGELPPDPQGQ
jgi:hypothetical protein